MKKLLRLIGLISALFSIQPLTSLAFLPPANGRLPDYDRRAEQAVRTSAVSSEQNAAVVNLRARLPQVRVDFDELMGTPKVVSALDGLLTGPAGQGKAATARAGGAVAAGDPDQPTKAFLLEHRNLFGHGPEALIAARVTREFVSPRNGLRTVVWQQQMDGIPVFESVLISHTTRSGELVNIAGGFIPDAEQVLERSLPNRARILGAPPITARAAITAATRDVGERVTEDETTAVESAATGPEQKQSYQSPQLSGEATAALIWVPMNRETFVLAWDVLLTSRSRGEMFRMLVDAQSGVVLLRRCLTEYLSDASYRVFTSDSPSPFSPGHTTPQTGQPPIIARTLVTWPAENTNASPNGWIDDGVNETRGNNVDAHLDRNNDNLPDTPRPQGSPFRVFDFALDFSQAPLTYTNAAVVELFYWNNWMHDRLYDLGFTEAAGNFQMNNFGRGGLGNDAVQADAQDGGGFNNANMSPPSDGSPARMQIYLFDGPTPDRDGDFDTEIVLHEYTHGLSNRRVGGGLGLTATQSRGMGEGWSDWYSLTLLSEPGDDVNAVYAAGGYATYLLSGLTTNYYFGIRRYPYCTDMTKNPLTFKDIDPVQASTHAGVPRSPIIGTTADEVHNQGEVWCMTLWEARANLIAKYGYATGNELILELVTDGMNLSPVNPNFLQARDGILQADVVDNGGANLAELWAAFAKRGMGYHATSPSSSTTIGLVEAYDVPDSLTVSPGTGFTGSGPVGGPFNPAAASFTLVNIGTGTVSWAGSPTVGWLSLSQSNGVLAVGGTNAVNVTLNASASSLPAGIYNGIIRFTNVTTGVTHGRAFALRIGQPDYFTELFDGGDNDLDNQTLTFAPDGSTNYYSVCREPALVFPTDSTGGVNLALGSHTYLQLNLANNISIYGRTTNIIFLSSEGHLTLLSGDSSGTVTLANHFSRPRVCASLAHIHPTENGGRVSWMQLSNRVVFTFDKVVEYSTTKTNSFQIELFYDGLIRMTHLACATATGLVGLSAGTGIPAGFLESDLSSYGPCVLPMTLAVVHNATEGDGVLIRQGQVNLFSTSPTNRAVNLASSDTSEVTVPATVTILAGQTTTNFDLTVVDDSDLDGPQSATITASAAGYAAATDAIQISDNESAELSLNVPVAVTEGSAPVSGTILASVAPTANILVSLSSSDPTEIQVPPTALLLAGQTSVAFSINVVNDTQIDGEQSATITAHVPNWADGVANLTIHDDEPLDLAVALPASAREGNGVLLNAGTVRISGTLPTNLVVSLLSSDTTELTVPSTSTIIAGQTLATFNLTIVDDPDVDSSQSVTVTASATGFATGVTNMTVTDDESPFEPFNPFPAHLATNVLQTSDLSWQSGALPGEVITNDVYFGTNPTPGAAELLGTTSNTNWSLPLLAPQTTYYWQVVARKTGVTPGPVWRFSTRGVDHFAWSPISSPQFVSAPFSATVTAKDSFETTVSNFIGTVSFSGSGSGGQTTNTILGNVVHSTTGSGSYTLAMAITPNANLTVTHVRSYSGTKVSIWSNGGALLASQNVSGPAGTWTETPLASPLQLTAGTTYRVSFYTGGGTYYYREDRPSTFPNGTLVDGYYYSSGDVFPSTFYNVNKVIFLCDLRYVVGAPAPAPITPTVSGLFTDGKWTGNLAVLSPATNLTLRADDNNGHIGLSSPLTVQLQNDIAVTVADSPDPVSLGGNFTYAITITNIGPDSATDVIVTNILPVGAVLVSVFPSQGDSVTNGNLVVCNLGPLAADASATVSIVVTATSIGVLTNRIMISRAEADAYAANNAAIATTTVATPMISINDVSRFEGNSGTASAFFTVAISPPPVLPVSVNFATLSGTAVAPTDFISTNGTLGFAPGETNKNIVVVINGDALYELNETFTVNLSAAINANFADSQGVGTILNDDPIPTLSISDAILAEGNSVTSNAVFTASLSAVSGLSVTASYATINGSAASGSDYVTKSGSLTIPAGSTSSNIVVAVNGDLQIESDEVFYVDLSSAGNAILLKREGYGLILNDDGLPGEIDHFTWSAIASPQYAGLPFGVTINALDAFNNPAINFNGLAYSNALTGPGTTNVLGTNTTTTSFPMYTGYDDERTQVIYPASELGGAGRITALALDVATVPGLSLNNWTIRIKHTPLTNYTSYVWDSTGWTVVYQTNFYVTTTGWVVFPLTAPFDYDGTNSLMVDFSFNNSTYSSVGYCRSTLRSTTRTVYYYTYSSYGDPLTWSGSYPSPYTSAYTPNLQLIRVSDSVSIQPVVTGPFTNGAWVGDVTALAPATNLVLRANDGDGHTGVSAPLAVLLRDDIAVSVADSPDPVGVGANLTYTISVTNTGPSVATGVLLTNRLPPSVTLVSVNPSQGTYTNSGQTVVCNLGTINGGSQATVAILVTPTATGAVTNVAAVSRAEVDNYGANNAATNTTTVIVPLIAINNLSVAEGSSGTTDATFTVSLSVVSAQTVSVNYATANGTAFAGSDYLATAGVLNFAPGQTNLPITVQILGDTNSEQNETFSVVLSSPVNATLGLAVGTGTILNDDLAGILAVFRDSRYVDITSGGASSEASNVVASLQSLGFPTAAFTNISPAASTYARLLFPELEVADLSLSLAAADRVALSNFVSSGGILIVHGDANGNIARFLNLAFGLAVVESAQSSTATVFTRTAQAAGTPFSTGPASITGNSGTSTLATNSLPLGAVSIYQNSAQSAVALIPRGNGGVVFLGWDWYNAVPIGTANNNWLPVLAIAAGLTFGPQPPVIVTSPANQTVMLGDAATFNVGVSGSIPLFYQWRKNGTNVVEGGRISGAVSNRLTILNVQTNDAGPYSVMVTNLYGSVLSSDATLTVEVPQPPSVPFGPIPTNYATGVSVHTLLSWNNSALASEAGSSAPIGSVDVNPGASGADMVGRSSFFRDGVAIEEGVWIENPSAASPVTTADFEQFNSTLINFDDLTAPCGFINTTRLTDRYASQGVTFAGPGGNDGGAILNQCGFFNVSGFSPPNFLAFNSGVAMSDGGIARGPETLYFSPPVSQVRMLVGSGLSSGTVTVQAFNAANVLVSSTNVTSASVMSPLMVSGAEITRVVVSTAASILVIDDLSFDFDFSPVTYDVYLGTNAAAMTLIASNLTQPGCDPGALAFNTTYYWQVVATNIVGSITGAVWQFTTTLDEVHFALATSSVTETGASATITVVRENPAGGTLSVQYSTSNGTATAGSDYTAVSGTLLFPAGGITTNFQVPILEDSASEGNETVLLRLSQPSPNVLLAAPSNAVLAIVDNDGPPDFQIVGLFTNNSRVVDHDFLTSDDRGGIAVSASQAFITGDSATARFNAADLTGGVSLARIVDSLCTDLRTETVYALGNGTNALSNSGGTVTTLIELNGNTGQPSGVVLPLSQSFSMPSSGNGIFSGYGRVVVHNGTRIFDVFLPSGTVTDRGTMARPNWQYSESWSVWGVAEYFGGTLFLTYRESGAQRIVRSRVPDGLVASVATFSNLSDMASFTVSPSRNRWYFHYEGNGQFGGSFETLGYADAQFTLTSTNPPVIASQPASQTMAVGGSATFCVTASGSAPLSYFWQRNGSPIAGATQSCYTLTNCQWADSGSRFSCIVSNGYGYAFSGNAALTITATASNVVINAFDTGWYDAMGNHSSVNANYFAGDNNFGTPPPLRDWFAFNLPSLPAIPSSAHLRINTYVIQSPTGSETYQLRHVSTPVGTLVAGGSNLQTIYDDLGDGHIYGSRTFLISEANQFIAMPLNAAFLTNLFAASGQPFAIGGEVTSLDSTPFNLEYLFWGSLGSPGDVQLILSFAIEPSPLRFVSSSAVNGDLRLTLGTVDGSPITAQRAAGVWVYAATNLAMPFEGWTPVNVAPMLTNGVLQVDGLSVTNAAQLFFRAMETP